MHKNISSKSNDITLFPVGLGTMGFGGFFDKDLKENNSKKHVDLIEEAYDNEVRVLDTAEIYGKGAAEETIGKTSKKVRENLFIMSKFSPENSLPDQIIRSLNGTLKRIRRDYVDVYQPHWPQPNVNIEIILDTLSKLKTEGKIRFLGLSNFSLEHIKSLDLNLYESLRFFQCEFNPIENKQAKELNPVVEKQDGILVGYSPFREGQIFQSSKFPTFKKFSQDLGYTPSQVLLAWCITNRKTLVIPKVSSSKHLIENVTCLNINLSRGEIDFISELFKPVVKNIKPQDIIPDHQIKEDKRKIYCNLKDAKNNIYNLSPGPTDIAKEIVNNNGNLFKPIKVFKDTKSNKYILVDGRLRFWAWIILFGWDKPIKTIIIENFN